MKKLLLITLILTSGCSSLSSRFTPPEVKPVEVITIEKPAPMYHPPLPNFYGLSNKGYENLSNNMAEVKRYIRQTLSVIEYYRELDKQNE